MSRKRRQFSPEYKAEVIQLDAQGDKSIGRICRDLDLAESAVRRWVEQAEIDNGKGLTDKPSTWCQDTGGDVGERCRAASAQLKASTERADRASI